MLELTCYGLTGLPVMLVIALCLTYVDEFQPARGKSSFDLINNAHLNDSHMIGTGTGTPRFRETVGKQQETATASWLQTTSPAETDPGAIYSDGFQSDCRQGEALHG
jgi:hypothetical protein